MLKFVDSDLYFIQDKNNFINSLLQVGSGSVEKSTGFGGPKITGSDRIRIRILIPAYDTCMFQKFENGGYSSGRGEYFPLTSARGD